MLKCSFYWSMASVKLQEDKGWLFHRHHNEQYLLFPLGNKLSWKTSCLWLLIINISIPHVAVELVMQLCLIRNVLCNTRANSHLWLPPFDSIVVRNYTMPFVSSVQPLSHVWLFVTPWTARHQTSLSINNS